MTYGGIVLTNSYLDPTRNKIEIRHTAGIYEVTGTVISLGYSPETTQQMNWWKNGSDTGISARAKNISTGANSSQIPMTATGFIQCAVGDTIQLVVAADSSGVIDYQNSSMGIRLVQ